MKTDKENLDKKIEEKNKCKILRSEPMETYNKNKLPTYMHRNLNYQVVAGEKFELTSKICCPTSHNTIGYIKYGKINDFHVCYK